MMEQDDWEKRAISLIVSALLSICFIIGIAFLTGCGGGGDDPHEHPQTIERENAPNLPGN